MIVQVLLNARASGLLDNEEAPKLEFGQSFLQVSAENLAEGVQKQFRKAKTFIAQKGLIPSSDKDSKEDSNQVAKSSAPKKQKLSYWEKKLPSKKLLLAGALGVAVGGIVVNSSVLPVLLAATLPFIGWKLFFKQFLMGLKNTGKAESVKSALKSKFDKMKSW